jgi:hypothetical protein
MMIMIMMMMMMMIIGSYQLGNAAAARIRD